MQLHELGRTARDSRVLNEKVRRIAKGYREREDSEKDSMEFSLSAKKMASYSKTNLTVLD